MKTTFLPGHLLARSTKPSKQQPSSILSSPRSSPRPRISSRSTQVMPLFRLYGTALSIRQRPGASGLKQLTGSQAPQRRCLNVGRAVLPIGTASMTVAAGKNGGRRVAGGALAVAVAEARSRGFSTTPAMPRAMPRPVPRLMPRGKRGLRARRFQKPDPKITLIRYHLTHPLTPRPLRFSRLRALRHWTIHRAWQLYRAKQRDAHERELERMYISMRDACEALRTLPFGDGWNGPQGYLFRKAMEKKGVWDGVPIEASRLQTEWPSRQGWNTDWKR